MLNESISETDPNALKDLSHSDETEINLVAEKRGNQLQQLNDSLQKDNSKLRAQFNEAVRIVQKVDDIHNKNISLSNELRDIKSEKEDLERRLQIALDINEDLNSQIANQKAALHEQRQNDLLSLHNEIKNSENQAKIISNDLNLKISQLEEEKEKISIELKIQQNIITRLVDSASHYFELIFDSPEKVITFLNQPPRTVNEAKTTFQTSNMETVKNETIDKTEKKNQRALKKLNEANLQILALKAEIDQSEKVHKTVENSYKKKIQILKEKVQQITDENQLTDEDNKHTILVLSQKVDSLQNSLKSAREELQNNKKVTNNSEKPKIVIESQTEKQSQKHKNPQIEAFEVEILTLQQKNDELKSINKKQEKKLTQFSEANQKLITENDELKKNFNKAFNDFSALSLIHESTMKEVETLRSILHANKPAASQISKKKKKIADLKEKVAQLKDELKEKQKKVVDEDCSNEEQQNYLKNQIDHYKSENGQLRSQIIQLSEKVDSLTNDLNFSKNTATTSQTSVNYENGLSQNPPQTSESSIPIQFQNRQIQQKIKKKLETIEKEKDEIMTQKESNEKEFSDFLLKISSIVLSKPFFVEDRNEILDSLVDMKKTSEALKQQNMVLSSVVKHMVNIFHFSETGDSSVLITDIDGFYIKFERKLNLLKKRKILINRIQKDLCEKAETIENLQQELKKSDEEKEKLNESLKKFDQEYTNLSRTVQSQEMQISNFEDVVAKKEAANDQRHNELLMEWKQQETSLRHTISEISMKSDELKIQNSSLVESNEAFKSKIQDYKAKLVALNLRIKELGESVDNQKNSLEKEFALERSNYEETIKRLQQDADAQRSDTERLAKQLACAKAKLKKMKCDVKNIKEKEAHFQLCLNEERNQLEREKQLIIGNAKAQTLLAESEYASKLDERRNWWEKEKRKIFSYVADQFRQFFNPIDVIDEMSFKNVIARVRDELIRMNNMDLEIRRLVGANCHQKTEDAVAQVVIGQPDFF